MVSRYGCWEVGSGETMKAFECKDQKCVLDMRPDRKFQKEFLEFHKHTEFHDILSTRHKMSHFSSKVLKGGKGTKISQCKTLEEKVSVVKTRDNQNVNQNFYQGESQRVEPFVMLYKEKQHDSATG